MDPAPTTKRSQEGVQKQQSKELTATGAASDEMGQAICVCEWPAACHLLHDGQDANKERVFNALLPNVQDGFLHEGLDHAQWACIKRQDVWQIEQREKSGEFISPVSHEVSPM